MKFFVGLHQPSDAKHFASVCLAVQRLQRRRSLTVADWIMDSGAFTTLDRYGCFPQSVRAYAREIRRWKATGNLLAVVTQDYMCEPLMLAKTGLTVRQHQTLTIERYDALYAEETGAYIMPVLQGYHPWEYVQHLALYGSRLARSAWVGVGSICKRNSCPKAIAAVLLAIHQVRPDLRLHGFGVKLTALQSPLVRQQLWSADSMAWSYHARKNGRNPNDWREADALVQRVTHGRSACWNDLPLFSHMTMAKEHSPYDPTCREATDI